MAKMNVLRTIILQNEFSRESFEFLPMGSFGWDMGISVFLKAPQVFLMCNHDWKPLS